MEKYQNEDRRPTEDLRSSASASSYSFSAPMTGAKWLMSVDTPVSLCELDRFLHRFFYADRLIAKMRRVYAVIFFDDLRKRAQFRVRCFSRVHVAKSGRKTERAFRKRRLKRAGENIQFVLGKLAERFTDDRAPDRGVPDERAEVHRRRCVYPSPPKIPPSCAS